jgi:hypothetical protein
MSEFAHNQHSGPFSAASEGALDQRLLRSMVVVLCASVAVSPFLAPWRVTTGLLLGGLMAVLSHRWMRSSISAAFTSVSVGTKPRIGVIKFVLRYFIIGMVVYAAYAIGIVSLPATIIGLCIFVVALFVEAFREFYLTIVLSRGN